ncbi:MAG: hypothetical protein JNK77_12345 [Saprospiraceae bacterium]|nr:hypothetical protein [Saprospiraceae bacterium]
MGWVLNQAGMADAMLQLARPLELQFEDHWDARQRLEVLLAAMSDLQHPCLLVIDNANDLSDLEAGYQYLRRCSNFHLLLTTRITHFERAPVCPIGGLPPDDALALFEQYYRPLPEDERALFFQIREAVGGNTLVLELLAKNLAVQNKLRQRYSLSELLGDLQARGLLQLGRTQTVGTDYQSKGAMRREKPEDIIAAMYDLGELPTEETALLSVFAALPAEKIPFEHLETLLGDEASEEHLLALAQKGWLEFDESDTSFKCSPVVQEITRLKNPEWEEDCRTLVLELVRKLNSEKIHEDNYLHSTAFTRYAETVIAVMNEPDDDVATLCQNIGIFHTATGDIVKALYANQKMVDIQNALFVKAPDDPDFKNGLAISYSKLGETHTALGNLDQALTFFENYNKLEKELYAAYPQNVAFKNGLAISYSKLGSFYRDKKSDSDKARLYFQQCYALWEELSTAFPAYAKFRNNFDWAKEALDGLK